jgi:hypothetical protein
MSIRLRGHVFRVKGRLMASLSNNRKMVQDGCGIQNFHGLKNM